MQKIDRYKNMDIMILQHLYPLYKNMGTIITSIFYITVLFNGSQHNIASCNDGRYYIQDIKITRMLKKKYLATNNYGERIICYYTK